MREIGMLVTLRTHLKLEAIFAFFREKPELYGARRTQSI